VTKAIEYCKKINALGKERITLTHIISQALAYGMYKMKRDIGRIRFGQFITAKEIGVTVLCDVEGGRDLVACTLWDAHKISL